jgi:hypothetical protein
MPYAFMNAHLHTHCNNHMRPSVTGRRINILGDICGTANAEVVGFPSSSSATDEMLPGTCGGIGSGRL